MGLFEKIFGHAPRPKGSFGGEFKLLNGYVPQFTTWSGGIYESELIRSAINARATHISKLKVEFNGSAKEGLKRRLSKGPSEYQTWTQFLYRLSTILDIHNTAFITPTFDEYGELNGVFCPVPTMCEIVQYNNKPYLRYTFQNGQRASMELSLCGIMTKFQYKSDLMGESNAALFPTMELINIQNQGIREGVKAAASYKFYAQLSNFSKAEDLAKERKRFTAENFGREAGSGGILLFPNTYTNINQVKAAPWIVDAEEMRLIKNNVYDYFGVNEDILQNKAFGDSWSAFYEGCVEWFSIMFSEVLSGMLYSPREISAGNSVVATANRLQYMANKDKLNFSVQMMDRGMMSINESREIWNLPPVEGGDVRIIRGEYYNVDQKVSGGNDNGN